MATDPSVTICITAAVDRMLEALEQAAPTPVEPQPWAILPTGMVGFSNPSFHARAEQETPVFFKAAGLHNAGVMRSGGIS